MNLFIISGPSGSGQDSVIAGIQKHLDIERVITTTTRPIRETESQGNPYYFISEEEFKKKIDEGVLLEWAHVYHAYYGVTYEEVDRVLKSGKIGIWKMDYKGVGSAKKIFPEIIAFMIKPVSFKELQVRLHNRSGSDKTFKERLEYTKEYFQHEHFYDYIIINRQGKLEEAVQEIVEIIKKHRE